MKYRRLQLYSIGIKRHSVIIAVVAILIFTTIAIVFFYNDWRKACPAQERPLGAYLSIVFGIASVLSLVISIYILKTLTKKTFSQSLDLLIRFNKILEDALMSQNEVTVSILHFVPCPGLFDEKYRREPTFSNFRSLIHEVQQRNNITVRVAMLEESSRVRFLQEFFKYEKKKISEEDLHRGGDVNSYIAEAEAFITSAFEKPPADKPNYIEGEWLDEILRGQQVIILGGANKVGFIGSVSFVGGNFQLAAADYEGKTEVIHALFDHLASAYE